MADAPPVLYVVICGSSEAPNAMDLIRQAQADGWVTCAITTPMGERFVDLDKLEELTQFPVRSHYKNPDEPDVLPVADAYVVAPATFNTVNKIANGISDTLAVGLVCEGIGHARPVILAPWPNRALARHGAYRRSIEQLRGDGVRLVLTDRTTPGGAPNPQPNDMFPWDEVSQDLRRVRRDMRP